MIPEVLDIVRGLYPDYFIIVTVEQMDSQTSFRSKMNFRIAIMDKGNGHMAFECDNFEDCIEAIKSWNGIFP